MPAEGRQEPANAHVGKRRNDAATFTMEKKKDAAAPHAPRMADMVRHCHRMAAVRGGGHMRRYVTTGRHGPGCQRQLGGKNGAPPAPFFRKYGAPISRAFSYWRFLSEVTAILQFCGFALLSSMQHAAKQVPATCMAAAAWLAPAPAAAHQPPRCCLMSGAALPVACSRCA
jgi:hypothetical protein